MQFGVLTLFDFFPDLQNEAIYYQDTLDLIVRADELGFDAAWIGEEHFYSIGICPRPPLFLAALAQRTRAIRLGSSVSLLPFDNPLRVAEDFAVVDVLSGGRLDVGVGRGAFPKHFLGFRVDQNETRARMEESIEVLTKAWTRDPFSHEGRFYHYPELSLSPKPIQKPHPPIWAAAVSPESFEWAGRTGHNLMVVPYLTGPFPEVKARLERYRTLLREHGHDPNQVKNMFVFFLFVDEDHRAAITEGREVTARYMQLLIDQFVSPAGGPPPEALQRQGDPFAPLRAFPQEIEERAVVGTPAACRKKIAELAREFGIDQMVFYLHAGARNIARARKSLELFAREVAPAFR